MEVILLENILNLGNIGDKVNVKPGYGRNYLLKTGKALRFNKENLELVKKKKDELIPAPEFLPRCRNPGAFPKSESGILESESGGSLESPPPPLFPPF